MRLAKLEDDYRCKNGVSRLKIPSEILSHGVQVYTNKMFKFFSNRVNGLHGSKDERDEQPSTDVVGNDVPILNPPVIRTKGLTNAQLKSILEKCKRKVTKDKRNQDVSNASQVTHASHHANLNQSVHHVGDSHNLILNQEQTRQVLGMAMWRVGAGQGYPSVFNGYPKPDP
ncbi:hypothetical protein Q3G72_021938 [Acer saccharum]|nr:hypothetical protein Q3G72_021938 [Acer saccharum]